MSFWKKFRNNKTAREAYLLKLKIIKLIREFFDSRGLLELEAPILQPSLIPESYLDIFSTEERRVGLTGKSSRQLFMLTSPESFQKKMMVAGFGSNYALTKSFRNGEALSGKHLSEFSLLEWYEKGKNYNDVMKTTEELFLFIAQKLNNAGTIQYNGQKVDLLTPWQQVSINEAFKQFLSIDLEEVWDPEIHDFSVKLLRPFAAKNDLNFDQNTTFEQLYNQLFLTYIEPKFPQDKPIILYDFPYEFSPLAKPKSGKKVKEKIWAERFEIMIAGLEICDSYTENTNAKLQEETFAREIENTKKSGKKTYEIDYDFIEAMKEGLPECSGNALGIDRMVMLFGDVKDISVFDMT